MRHFPVFVDLKCQRVLVSGASETAAAKLRLLLKTEALIEVYGEDACDDVRKWHDEGRLRWFPKPLPAAALFGARLVYSAHDNAEADAQVRAMGERMGVLVNVVDNLGLSQFITPAIVDRDPVTVAIGTEGAAPVLARRIKADVEERLPTELGQLAAIARHYREAAGKLPGGRVRRAFWSHFFDTDGPAALAEGGEEAARAALERLIASYAEDAPACDPGRVILVGAGPGDPELLTLKARRVLHEADVVLYDRLVDPRVLELARREAELIEVGKTPGGPAWKQHDINAAMIEHARAGALVVRLKSGDPMVFGRADEELDGLDAAGVEWDVVPGITSGSAAAASSGRSLTRRGRNQAITFLTAHDAQGYAEHDWRALAQPGNALAIYMGLRAARFVQGRLMLHGAAPETPVTIVENTSRPEEKRVSATLANMCERISEAGIVGPAIIFIGLPARRAQTLETEPRRQAV
ncbi:siroheme synthase CysG [Dichotomicrobium thermohalophilum]|uniref:Uroporphyrinogen-III C-methyltransferase n=1 Tax=Dichotomicrobium thermohalophilum TaxID=933063 RepID=A0A397Q233_9HYPH|nr:siroheme synthase CysG [Dichotomicrobium thermohalophilum]RIA55436.1 uroporphyrinogen-III C-methyltransferase [Dichotomicrobium thermohalophilum]